MNTTERRPLTGRQTEVFEMIHREVAAYGRPPTIREIGERIGVACNAVAGHVKALVAKGYIATDKRTARGIRLIDDPRADALEAAAVACRAIIDHYEGKHWRSVSKRVLLSDAVQAAREALKLIDPILEGLTHETDHARPNPAPKAARSPAGDGRRPAVRGNVGR